MAVRRKAIIILFICVILVSLFALCNCSNQSLLNKEVLASPERELVNFALASNGATAESPDNDPEHPPLEVIDGDTSSLDWDNGGGWKGDLSHLRLEETLKRSYVQVNLAGKRQLRRVIVYTIDSPKYPADKFGLRSYRLEYWHGTGWEKIPVVKDSRNKQYTVRDNKSGKLVHEIKGGLVADKIRLVPISSNDTEKSYNLTAFGGKPVYDITGAARVMEIQAWGYPINGDMSGLEKPENLFPVGKSRPSPDEQAIQEILSDYEQGYDNENLEQVMSGFSEDFLTLDGKKWTDIEEKAGKFFEEYDNINMTFEDMRLEIDPAGETAEVEVGYTLECVAVADGNIYRRSGILTFNFRKEEDSGWKITSAR